MTKKSKMFMAFDGTAEGLRDELIAHFKREAQVAPRSGGSFADGISCGEQSAYRDIVQFLKKLVINKSEHIEGTEA